MARRAALVFVLLLPACGDGAGSSPDTVANVVDGTIDLQIGVLDGPAALVFGRVSGIVEDGAGRILVSDLMANEVRVFDVDGEFIYSIGRGGEGPGELRGPCCLAFSPDGTLWVRDGGNKRYVAFAIGPTAAEPVATLRMAHSDVWFHAPLIDIADSDYIDTGHRFDETGRTDLVRFHLRPDGGVIRSEVVDQSTPEELGTVVRQDRTSRMFFPQPFGPESLVAWGPHGEWASAVSSRFEVTIHDAAGGTESVTGPPEQGPLLSSTEIDIARKRLDDYVRLGGGSASDYPAVPERKTQLADLMFDQQGRLWVSFNAAEGQPSRAAVFSPAGERVGDRTWPANVNLAFPAWIGGDHALGIATDSLGVQRIARVRFRE
jgi:6-bladed beta-propeller